MPKNFSKKIKYRFLDFFGNLSLALCVQLLRVAPPKLFVQAAKVLGALGFYLIKKYRQRVFSNLSLAFEGEKDPQEMTELAKEIFFNFTLTPLEALHTLGTPSGRLVREIKIVGQEYLDASLEKGNGVIALGSHLGSFTLLGKRLTIEGYPTNAIFNEGDFPKLAKRLRDYETKIAQSVFTPKPAMASIKKSINCLRRNEILYLVADEQQILGGLPVPFFGKTAYTAPGPAIFSLKTGAPILPMFIVRERGIPKTLFIERPVEIERTFDEKKDTELLTAAFTKAIEDSIRRYPEQWPWLNRRWKQPYGIEAQGR